MNGCLKTNQNDNSEQGAEEKNNDDKFVEVNGKKKKLDNYKIITELTGLKVIFLSFPFFCRYVVLAYGPRRVHLKLRDIGNREYRYRAKYLRERLPVPGT